MPRIKKPKPEEINGKKVYQCPSCKGYGNKAYGVHGKNYREYKCKICKGEGWLIVDKMTKAERKFWDEQTKIMEEVRKEYDLE